MEESEEEEEVVEEEESSLGDVWEDGGERKNRGS